MEDLRSFGDQKPARLFRRFVATAAFVVTHAILSRVKIVSSASHWPGEIAVCERVTPKTQEWQIPERKTREDGAASMESTSYDSSEQSGAI